MVFGFGKNKDRTKALEAVANAPVGAPVTVEGRRGVIRGTLVMAEAGDRWVEHLIDTQDGDRYWLSIENFDRTVATVWTDVAPNAVNGGPDDKSVICNGVTFRANEQGTAIFAAKGDVDLFDRGTIDYADFAGPDGARFSFERFGDSKSGRRARANTGTCPNCHAPLMSDSESRCGSCGSDLTEVHGSFGGWEAAIGRDVTDSAGLQ